MVSREAKNFIKAVKDFSHLSFACTLCGACNKVCPVQISATWQSSIKR